MQKHADRDSMRHQRQQAPCWHQSTALDAAPAAACMRLSNCACRHRCSPAAACHPHFPSTGGIATAHRQPVLRPTRLLRCAHSILPVLVLTTGLPACNKTQRTDRSWLSPAWRLIFCELRFGQFHVWRHTAARHQLRLQAEAAHGQHATAGPATLKLQIVQTN